MKNNLLKAALAASLVCLAAVSAQAQKYRGIVDKSVAIVGNEMISLSDVEGQAQAMRAQGFPADRCQILENMMQSKLFVAQARVDSLTVNQDQANAQLEQYVAEMLKSELADIVTLAPNEKFIPERRNIPRFLYLDMDERKSLAQNDPAYAQIVCRCETVTEGQVLEAIHRGARTVSAVKMMTRAGTGRCQGGFCTPKVMSILARELSKDMTEITKKGGDSKLLVGRIKEF